MFSQKICGGALTALLLLSGALSAQFVVEPRPIGANPDQAPLGRGLSIAEHRVAAEIRDGVATTTTTLVVRNQNRSDLEATFLFPLPENAAVADFSMTTGGKKMEGELLSADKARTVYEGIVRRRLDPALLEHVGKRLYKARVFPVPSMGEVSLELRYSETLTRSGNTLEYRVPYRTKSVMRSAVGKSSVQVKIHSEQPFLTVYSPSHEVEVLKKGDHDATVSFEATGDPGDRDFVLAYGLASGGRLGASLFAHGGDGKDPGSFMLLLAPSTEGHTRIAKDVVFVVDTSGSMAGEKLAQAQRALAFCVKSLEKEDRFNLLQFSTEVRSLDDALLAANAENKQAGLSWINDLKARGGTNIHDAIVTALRQSEDTKRPLMVVFVTDGEPTVGVTQPSAILAAAKAADRALSRVFVFGVGADLNVELLDALAEQNHGARDYVTETEHLETKVSGFFDKVSEPVLSDIEVVVEGVKVEDLHPRPLPDLFRGGQLLLTGRFRGQGAATVRVRGQVNGKAVEHVFEPKFEDGGDRTAFVPRLWAVRRVGWLLDQIRLNGRNDELVAEVTTLGKEYGILTPYTSWLVVEDEPDVATRRLPNGRRRGGWGADRSAGPGGGGSSGFGGPAGGATTGGVPGGAGGGGGFPATGNGGPGLPPRPAAPSADAARGSADGKAGTRTGEAGAPTTKPRDSRGVIDELARLARKKGEGAKEAPSGEANGLPPAESYGFELAERKDAEADARQEVERGYFGTAVDLSLQIKRLRDAQDGGVGPGQGLVKRVDNRTFYSRPGVWVESAVLDLAPEAITGKLVRIEAFSAEWFALATRTGGALRKILALGDSLLFVDGERLVQVVPKGSAVLPAKEGEKPATGGETPKPPAGQGK